VAEVIPVQTAVLHSGSTSSILDESTDSPAFSAADPKRMPTICTESTSTTDC